MPPLDLQSSNNSMDSKIQLGIIVAVIGLQALHLASVGKTLDYLHAVDDANSKSYTAYDSQTRRYSYQLGFAVVVAGATVLIYALLLIANLTGMTALSDKIKEILYGLVTCLQFALGVVLGITQSRLVDPNGSNGNSAAVYQSTKYKDFFSTQLADTVLIWVICIPGAYILAHFNSGNSPAAAKAQTSEMGLRN